MSNFPTGSGSSGPRTAAVARDARLETDGALVRPINGQIYLIEEEDLETLSGDDMRSLFSGIMSRH